MHPLSFRLPTSIWNPDTSGIQIPTALPAVALETCSHRFRFRFFTESVFLFFPDFSIDIYLTHRPRQQ